ncbi:MAG: hypothetical protein RMI56_02550 [Sulfolobales archaeon]|nr:hypothetical protein [Sulfolobales archaeon]
MSWKFWKSDLEKFEEELRKAFEDRSRGKIEDAISHFQEAYEIAQKSSNAGLRERGRVAYAYALIYRALLTRKPEDFSTAAKYLREVPPDVELDLALPKPVRCGDLADELVLLEAYYSTPEVDLVEPSKTPLEAVDRLESTGRLFLSRRGRRFLLEDVVGIHEPFEVVGMKMLGLARVVRAAHTESEDISRAVELYAEALAYLAQASDRLSSEVRGRVEKLGRATKCWFCGRAVQGEDLNYVYLDTFLTKHISNKYGGETPNLVRENSVAVCRACYGAVYRLSDRISRHYHEEAMKALKQLEDRLVARIRALEQRVSSLESRISTLRPPIQPKV